MKKFLSLVLALVMTMSLVVVGASASDKFSDASSIQYPEAVDVVAACKIIDGYADGSFKAGDTLTRGAAAKIICNMILGPTTASALGADVAPFPDVAVNHTFAGYIAYCAQQGIINGYADGNFYPAKTVTGYQFMKMLLGALGYDGTVEGYTGGNWSVNVAKTALGIGLDDGNDAFVGTAAMTREEACLYAFNTIKADMVEYDTNLVVNNGALNTTSKAKKLTYTSAGLSKKYDGQIDGTTKTEDDVTTVVGDGVVQFGEKYFQDLKKTDTGADDFKRPATEWKYKSNSVGTYADSDKLIKTYTKSVEQGDLYTLVGKSVVDDLKDDEALFNVYVDGEPHDIAVANCFVKDSTAKIGVKDVSQYTGNGVVTEVYLDDDTNAVTLVIINTYLMQADSDYNSSKEELSVSFVDNGATDPGLDSTISQDDFDVSGYKEDDYLLVTFADGDIQTVAKAAMVDGEVTTYTTKDSVTVAGTKYKYNALVNTDNKTKDFTIGEKAALVMDAYGYIAYVDEATVASTNYVFIRESAKDGVLASAAIKSDAYFLDGTNTDITLYKVNDVKAKDIEDEDDVLAVAGWYTYTVGSDGKYTLKTPSGDYKAFTGIDYAKDKNVTINGAVKFLYNVEANTTFNSAVKGNSDTICLVLNSDGDVDVYTGVANIPTVTNTKKTGSTNDEPVTVTYVNKGSYVKYLFIDAKAASGAAAITDDAAATDQYTLVLKQNGKKINVDADTFYYECEALVNGEVKTGLKMESSNSLVAGTLYTKIKTNSDGYITGGTDVTAALADPKYDFAEDVEACTVAQSSGTVTFTTADGSQSFVLTSDAKIYLAAVGGDIMKDSGADYETYLGISASALASKLKDYAFDGTIYGVKTDNTETCETLKTLYVYVSGTDGSKFDITKGAITTVTGYTYTIDKTSANLYDTITVKVTAAKGSAEKAVTVHYTNAADSTVDLEAFTLTATADASDSDSVTFAMPAKDTTVTVTLADVTPAD